MDGLRLEGSFLVSADVVCNPKHQTMAEAHDGLRFVEFCGANNWEAAHES